MLEQISARPKHARRQTGADRGQDERLNEPQVIRALYEASRAGVEIDPGRARRRTLRPGIPGVSTRIRVRSVVGRFLEPPRVVVRQRRAPELLLLRRLAGTQPCCAGSRPPSRSSTHPARSGVHREGLLDNYLADNQNAWALDADGGYRQDRLRTARRRSPGRNCRCSTASA